MRPAIALLSICVVAACNGAIGEPGADGEDRRDDPAPVCEGPVCVPDDCDGTCVGASGLTRLTRAQYANAVRDLFAVSVETERLPRDHEVYESFGTNEPEPISEDDVDRYSTVAESAAASVDVAAITACTPAEDDASCGRRFVEAFAERVHRRPVSLEVVEEYDALLGWSLADGDSFEDAIRLVVSAFLQSPAFIYRIERASDGVTVLLDGWELASRLSFFLWQTVPDAQLLAAAAAGDLDTPDGIAREARRLLADPRSDDTIRAFHSGWLGISQVELVARTSPEFDEELGRAMRRETEELALHVLRDGDGHLETLLTPGFTILDARMAAFYGATEGRVTVPDRPGLLSHASLMTAHAADAYTDPIYRGKMVRQRFFCQSLVPPPDVAAELAEREAALPEDLDEHERLTALTGNDPCVGCHVLTNDIGFGFASYDAIGRFRVEDSTGSAIDPGFTVATVPGYETDVDGDYDDLEGLSAALASSEDVALCMAAQWTRFALGRRTDEDGTSIMAAYEAFEASGGDLRELVVAVTRTDAFRHRTVRAP